MLQVWNRRCLWFRFTRAPILTSMKLNSLELHFERSQKQQRDLVLQGEAKQTANRQYMAKNGFLGANWEFDKAKLIKIPNLYPKSHFWLCAVCLKNPGLLRITLYYCKKAPAFLSYRFEFLSLSLKPS